jgi:predicted phage-related endonuclease
MGACPPAWGDAHSIWASKKGLLVKEENDAMRFGHTIEPVITEDFITHFTKEHLDGKTFANVELNTFLQHPTLPIVGTPDFLADVGDSKMGAEFKSTGSMDGWGLPETDEIPLRVKIQCNTYMLLTGLDKWEVHVLFGDRGFKFCHYTIFKDAALVEKIKATAITFWDTYMEDDCEPEKGTVIEVKCIDEEAPMEEDLALAMREAIRLKKMIDTNALEIGKYGEQYDSQIDKIKTMLGERRYAKLDGWKADWNRRNQAKPDFESMYHALKAKYVGQDADFIGMLENEHTKRSVWQRFMLSKDKGSK